MPSSTNYMNQPPRKKYVIIEPPQQLFPKTTLSGLDPLIYPKYNDDIKYIR